MIAAALFVAAATAGGGYVQSRYYQQAADQTAKHKRWAKNEMRSGCPSFANLSEAQCTYQATQAAQESERAEYDLYAQRTSALWAAVMAFAALLGIGLSGVGVYLVWTTFQETKRGADLAKSSLDYTKMITQRQVEAIVYFAGAEYQDKPEEDVFDLSSFGIVTFSLQNFGKTIAYNVEATIDILAPDFDGTGQLVLAEEKFGREFYPAGRTREYKIEFRWPTGLKKKIVSSYQPIEIAFSIIYQLDSGEGELHADHEGSMLAFLTGESSRADFIPPYKGWHTSE